MDNVSSPQNKKWVLMYLVLGNVILNLIDIENSEMKFDTNVKIWWFYNFVTFLWLTLPTKQSIIVYIIFFILKNIASRSLDVKSYIYKFQRRWIESMDIISSKINQTVLNMTVNYKKIIPIYFFIRFIQIYMKDKYVSMGLNYLVIIQCTCTLFIDWLESWHEFVAS